MKKVLTTFALAIISMSGSLMADMEIVDSGFVTHDTPTCVTPDYPEFVDMDSTSYCVCVKSPCPCKGYDLAEYDDDSDIILAGGCSISATGSSANGGSVSVTITCNIA